MLLYLAPKWRWSGIGGILAFVFDALDTQCVLDTPGDGQVKIILWRLWLPFLRWFWKTLLFAKFSNANFERFERIHWGNRVKLVKLVKRIVQSVIVDRTPWIRRLLFASQLDIMTMHLNFEVTNQKACHCHHHPGGFLEFGVFPMKRCFRWLLSS